MSPFSTPFRSGACAALVGFYVLLFGPVGALANGPEIGFDAGCAFPLESKEIELQREFVTVWVTGGGPSKATCSYALRNLTQEPQTIQMGFLMGFPGLAEPPHGTRYRDAGITVNRWIQGEEGVDLPVRLAALDKERWKGLVGSPPDSLPVWEVEFGPSQEVNLDISYETELTGGCGDGECTFGLTYYAQAARLWAARIEWAVIEFRFDQIAALLMACHPDLTGCLEVSATPPGFTRPSWGFRWEMRDWEPETDFNVTVQWPSPRLKQ